MENDEWLMLITLKVRMASAWEWRVTDSNYLEGENGEWLRMVITQRREWWGTDGNHLEGENGEWFVLVTLKVIMVCDLC